LFPNRAVKIAVRCWVGSVSLLFILPGIVYQEIYIKREAAMGFIRVAANGFDFVDELKSAQTSNPEGIK